MNFTTKYYSERRKEMARFLTHNVDGSVNIPVHVARESGSAVLRPKPQEIKKFSARVEPANHERFRRELRGMAIDSGRMILRA